MTFHAREIQSYRELPQIWYHLQTKDRDEPRPRGGLLRVREFIMKDGYSFDRDEAGLDESFQKHSVAYKRIFERCGLETYEVAAESGMMGGSGSKDFLAPSGSGENTLVTCENGDYAADLEIAEGRPSHARLPRRAPGAGGGRDTGPADDRGGLGVSRRRSPGDREGDAGRGRRARRARPGARRRPAKRDEAPAGARRGLPGGRARGDPRGLRGKRRLDRPGRRRGRR